MKIGLIACPNGLGHTRRMLALSNALNELGADPCLIASRSAIETLRNATNISPIELIDFDLGFPMREIYLRSYIDWTNRLPDLDRFDLVVSDNLIEILAKRPDAWLSGSFFWHEALPNCPINISSYLRSLLEKNKPKVISSALFSADYLSKNTELHEVGLFCLGQDKSSEIGNDFLITCGFGGDLLDETRELVRELSCLSRPLNAIVWVEPRCYSSNMPPWIKPASYTNEMYRMLRATICRPGVGTVTDSLVVGSKLFTFSETSNFEMKFIEKKLVAENLSESCESPRQAWDAAIRYSNDYAAIESHRKLSRRLDFEGARQAAQILLGMPRFR